MNTNDQQRLNESIQRLYEDTTGMSGVNTAKFNTAGVGVGIPPIYTDVDENGKPIRGEYESASDFAIRWVKWKEGLNESIQRLYEDTVGGWPSLGQHGGISSQLSGTKPAAHSTAAYDGKGGGKAPGPYGTP